MPGHRRRHQADRPRAGDQDVLADQRERQRGVHGVAERVEDRGDVEVHRDAVHPHVRRGQCHVLGEGAVPADTEPVEAVAEDLAVKQELFRTLDKVCKPGAVLATT
ncbi:3-hydroxyacyl-CoA dehydrogenase NAD-binding domain-containing protein, partial [Streptomyces sp. NPDC001739]